MDGAVYEWDTSTAKRVRESVEKLYSYTSVTMTPDSKTTFAVGVSNGNNQNGQEGSLQEIADSSVIII